MTNLNRTNIYSDNSEKEPPEKEQFWKGNISKGTVLNNDENNMKTGNAGKDISE